MNYIITLINGWEIAQAATLEDAAAICDQDGQLTYAIHNVGGWLAAHWTARNGLTIYAR